mmetsp:Transcript_35023/g.39110  ORF Transcript_35023/g.39110 Transcript_35023/m.39110 type:complete len:287 (-) Transcript_35023:67-927(-)
MAALADERTPLVPSLTKSSSNGTTTITNTTTSTPQMIIKKFYSKFVPAFIGIITVFALLFFYAGRFTANTIDTAKNNSSGTIVSMSTISSLNPIPSPNASPSLNPTSSSPSLSLSPSASLLNSTSSPSPSSTSQQTELDFILTITTPASNHQSTTTVYIGPPLSNTPTTATDDGPSSSSSSLNRTSISTTAPTLSSPTATTDILCVDDLLEYKGKAKYNCHWVGKGHKKKRKKKCKRKKNYISNICRETCGIVGVGPCHFLHKNKGKVELYQIEETTYYVVKEGKQ